MYSPRKGIRPGTFAGILCAGILFLSAVPAAFADMPVIQLTIRNGQFVPDTLVVPANVQFKLHIKNEGPGLEDFLSRDLNRVMTVGTKHPVEMFFGPFKAGSHYNFIGKRHPQTAKGQMVVQ